MLPKYIRIGPKIAHQVVYNIEQTRSCNFKEWLVACGIPKIGPQKAETIARNRGTFSDFITLAEDETKMAAIIGSTLAKSLCGWVRIMRHFWSRLLALIFNLPRKTTHCHYLGLFLFLLGNITYLLERWLPNA